MTRYYITWKDKRTNFESWLPFTDKTNPEPHTFVGMVKDKIWESRDTYALSKRQDIFITGIFKL